MTRLAARHAGDPGTEEQHMHSGLGSWGILQGSQIISSHTEKDQARRTPRPPPHLAQPEPMELATNLK